MDPGDPREKMFTGLDVAFGTEMLAGTNPDNLQVHPCSALALPEG